MSDTYETPRDDDPIQDFLPPGEDPDENESDDSESSETDDDSDE